MHLCIILSNEIKIVAIVVFWAWIGWNITILLCVQDAHSKVV